MTESTFLTCLFSRRAQKQLTERDIPKKTTLTVGFMENPMQYSIHSPLVGFLYMAEGLI